MTFSHIDLTPPAHVHLIGIGGAGMSAIARVLLGRGLRVSGSDRQANGATAALIAAGAQVFQGHAAGHIAGARLVVRSSAVPDDNPEVAAARAAGVPVLKRSDFLGELMAGSRGIAVSGTHGKTTTTGMIAHVLLAAGLDPTIIVGGDLPGLGHNGRAGRGPHFVVEADEYDHMFLGLRPDTAVVTNVEFDHPDIYPTAEAYAQAYDRFVERLPEGGRLVACLDDPGAARLLRRGDRTLARTGYGLKPPTQPGEPTETSLQAVRVRPQPGGGTLFDVEANGRLLGAVTLPLPGRHNVANALAVVGALLPEAVSFETIAAALADFQGMGRRFEVKGTAAGVTVVDDYAHHPTEITATLQAARARFPDSRLWAVWQPHTFSRTRLFLEAFRRCFTPADRVAVLEIYRSRETDSLGLSGAALAGLIDHPHSSFVGEPADAAQELLPQLRPGDVVVIMNAGDASAIAGQILTGLHQNFGKELETETINQTRSA